MKINQKGKNNFRFSKLLNDKFCIYYPKETRVYQFNNEDFTVTLLKRINVHLSNLIEIDDNVFINTTDNYFYIWKKLKPIYKWDQMSFIILIWILDLIIGYKLKHLGKILVFLFDFILSLILLFILRFYVHFLNPYKKIKAELVEHIEKCGKNICCLKSDEYTGIYNYKNNKILKKIKFNNNTSSYITFFIINENIIIFTDENNKNCQIYDISLDKIINNFYNDFIIDYKNTFKNRENLYITCFWKTIIIKNITNNKFFILTENSHTNGGYVYSLFIYN